jgi:ATP-GRASP peptide maturase of grasp-with-spasm system
MILIFSSNFDFSTVLVERWLKYHSFTNYTRVNTHDLTNIDYDVQGKMIVSSINIINTEDVKVVWMRRHRPYILLDKKDTNPEFYKLIYKSLSSEYESILKTLYFRLNRAYWLNHPSNVSIPKLIQLEIAQRVGLEIPATKVISSKAALLRFTMAHRGIITKAIDILFNHHFDKSSVLGYTSEIDEKLILELPESFFPSLVQERIEKQFEIRVFYLDGIIHSVAMFSQAYRSTTLDFRNSDPSGKKVRTIPFILPQRIQDQISELMSCLSLNSGSLDLIFNKNDEFVFLEVNPVGQFGWISESCNLQLERLIAQKLMKAHG